MTGPRLRELQIENAYSTGTNDLLADFYLPCLSKAIKYRRAVGFFRSSLYAIAGLAFADFLRRDGRIRLICSPSFTKEDLEAIGSGLTWRQASDARIASDLQAIITNPSAIPAVQFLATMIAADRLEMRVAVRPSTHGIFHDKLGVFIDHSTDALSFVGSANESLSAWDHSRNHEGFEVFRSWGSSDEAARVTRHLNFFDALWDGLHPGVSTLTIPEAATRNLLEVSDPDGIDASAEKLRDAVRGPSHTPPTIVSASTGSKAIGRVLQQHQQDVLKSWEAAGRRGIVAHVTGAGKTVTALEAVRRWISEGRPALILVPSELLLKQWQSEIRLSFDDSTYELLLAGGPGRRTTWEDDLREFTRDLPALGPRIVLATMQTAVSEHFRSRIRQGKHLLFVGDEVHRLGAPSYRPILHLTVGATLGLSATPQRFGDPSGTSAIFAAFGSELQPRIDIGDAIRLGRLVPYDYHVHRVHLTDDEADLWQRLTDELIRVYATLPRDELRNPVNSRAYELLLFKRARVVKQAAAKVPLAAEIIRTSFRHGDRWLVYCDDTTQLRSAVDQIRLLGTDVYEYHSAMDGSRDATMQAFTQHGGVLVAIKCLDEGVDIPKTNCAVILASSSNPREFIQRRGRVLRAAPDKFAASIHDAIVLPPITVTTPSPDAIPAFAKTDLKRALAFAGFARNTAVSTELRMWAAELGIRFDGVADDGSELEEDEDARE
jgi:superfamily II DNA or RNA helicase